MLLRPYLTLAFTDPPPIAGTNELGQNLTDMDGMILDGAVVSRRWLLCGAIVSTARLYTVTAPSLFMLEVTAQGANRTTITASKTVGTTAAQAGNTLNALTLSAALAYGVTSLPIIRGKSAGSTLQFVKNSLTLLASTGGKTISDNALTGTPTDRLFLIRETAVDGMSRDNLFFAPKPSKHIMGVGMGVAGINYYTPNNVFLDNLKYAGTLTPPATSDANGMPLTLGVDGNGQRGAAYIMTLESLGDTPNYFHVITDGDMDFSGHVKRGRDWVCQQPAGRSVFTLNITAIRRAPTYIKYVREDEVVAAKAGKIFKQTFLAEMRKFPHVRYMNWHGGNSIEPCSINENNISYADQFGVPLSVIAKACQEARHDLYLNIHAKTTLQDFIYKYIPILDNIIASGLNVYLEHSNEVWNSIFSQYLYGRDQAVKLGFNGNEYFASTWWNGYRTAQLAKASRDKGYRWVIGPQTVQQGVGSAHLLDGIKAIADQRNSDIWGYHASTYGAGTLTLGVDGDLGNIQDAWVANSNYDAAFDNLLTYSLPVPGAYSQSIDSTATTFIKEAKQIADDHGWILIGYEGNFHLNANPYSRVPDAYNLFFYKMIEHPLAGPATTYSLESWEDAGFAFVTMFDWDSEPGNSNNGRFGMRGHPGYDAVVAWNDNVAGGRQLG